MYNIQQNKYCTYAAAETGHLWAIFPGHNKQVAALNILLGNKHFKG